MAAAGNVPLVTPAANQLAKVPPLVWFLIALGLGLAAMVWHRFGQDEEDTDWLDPGQPPINLTVDFTATLPGQLAMPGMKVKGAPKMRKYPWGSLLDHPCCWVGDC